MECSRLALGAALALAALGPSLACAQREAGPRTPVDTVLLVTLDTTRADHLGVYGYERRPTSPNLDAFAEDALVYENMIASGVWTLPSHASIFTGKFVTSHGARNDREGPLLLADAIEAPEGWRRWRLRTISPEQVTLAELLAQAGFATGAVVGGPYMKRVFGLARGFDHYDDDGITTVAGRPAEEVTSSALDWLARSSGRRFLFLNYFDPHSPYRPPDEFARPFLPEGTEPDAPEPELRIQRRLYDAEIRYMDHHLGRLFEGLRELGLYESALIIVTGDHGELLGEHGFTAHGGIPLQGVIHVPMIVRDPDPEAPRGRTKAWVSLADVFPLVLERLGLPIPDDIQGEVPPHVEHPVITEQNNHAGAPGPFRALVTPSGLKLITRGDGEDLLFDLADDPR